jgi:hypothetical protein
MLPLLLAIAADACASLATTIDHEWWFRVGMAAYRTDVH